MSFFILCYCRLAVNYVTTEDNQTLTLQDAYQACLKFYSSQSQLCAPSKELIGRMIPRIFGINSFFKYENSERKLTYKNLKQRKTCDSEVVVHVPDYCSTFASTDTYVIKCPLSTIFNGKQQFCFVNFGKNDTWLTIKDTKINCGFPLKIEQQNIDGMIHIVCAIKLCNGIQHQSDFTSKAFITENVSMLHDQHSNYNIHRSKSCKIFLNWCAKTDVCETCQHSFQTNLKRKVKKSSNEDENITSSAKKTCVDVKKRKVLVEKNITEPDAVNVFDQTDKQVPVLTKSVQTENKDNIDTCSNSDTCTTVKLSEEDHDDMEKILDLVLKTNVPENFVILLKSQLCNCRKGLEIHQRRWDPKVISLCLTLFIRSPQAFNDLKKSGFLELPSKRLLQYYKNSVKQSPGFNKGNLTWMMQEISRQNVSEFGRHGGLVIDEMSIQDDLIITKSGDTWNLVGFVDMDTTNNNIDIICNGKKKVQLATHALQFVFHGLTGFR